MSKDIKMTYDSAQQEWDVTFGTSDIVMEYGLQTAVEMSLFTDQRAADDDILPDENTDKKGWWGDLISPEEDSDEIGSKLWLLRRSKTTNDNLKLAKQWAEESLEWMITDKVAAKIVCNAYRQGEIGNDVLALKVEIYKQDGTKQVFEYDNLWENS